MNGSLHDHTDVLNRIPAPLVFDSDDTRTKLVWNFFALFSRFECALKRAGYYIKGKKLAQPNWDTFANSLQNRFDANSSADLKRATDYLNSHPPKRQVIKDDHLDWEDQFRQANESDIQWLLRLIRLIRNNLFHGGKYRYPAGPIADSSRDQKLLESGIIVLLACAKLDSQIWGYLEAPLD